MLIRSYRPRPRSAAKRQAPSDRPAFQPYWGKPAVRNDREDRGNVGIIRSPVRASILPDRNDHQQLKFAVTHKSRRELAELLSAGPRFEIPCAPTSPVQNWALRRTAAAGVQYAIGKARMGADRSALPGKKVVAGGFASAQLYRPTFGERRSLLGAISSG